MYYYENSLYHHGIKGMKWGVRRYQNPDGSLTAAGKRRYDIAEARSNLKAANKRLSDAQRKASGGYMGQIFGLAGRDTTSAYNKRKVREAEFKVYDARAALGKAKKGAKGERRAYKRMMWDVGLSGSIKDIQTGGKGTEYYDYVAKKKGKAYAASIENSLKKEAVAAIVGSTALYLGSYFINDYLNNR